ncbi:hypothetical protein [Blastococcus tunisiensis]|uniref:Lipoprotein n=1 Tax=Blastococcus tunisiensis TaxID=1798228 RepID=A0A1I1Y8W0_9ACTN|nr:hypothetical protein [Blastococcus sp. DSM 46838]SFE16065.1 hypothetical protein SAMN05216574_102298 [Blastococcus sp. DSM 46838]
MSAQRRRRGRSAVGAILAGVAVLTGTAGCGFLDDLATTEAEDRPDEASPDSGAVPVVVAPDPDLPVVVAEGDLHTAGGGPLGHLVVTQGPVRTGLVPPVPGFSSTCPVEGPSLQYVALDFTYTSTSDSAAPLGGLAAHVSVSAGPGTPPDIGDVGVFADSGGDPGPYCADYPPLPTTDTFWNQMGADSVTVFVVLDRAVGPGSPDGRSDAFPTVQLRISELRWFTDPASVRRLSAGEMSAGAACSDDPAAFCAQLG